MTVPPEDFCSSVIEGAMNEVWEEVGIISPKLGPEQILRTDLITLSYYGKSYHLQIGHARLVGTMSCISSLVKIIFGLSEEYILDFSINCGKILHVGTF